MLHDPSHYEPPPIAHEIEIGPRDTDVLRRLADELAGYAALPIHAEKARLWQRAERPALDPGPWSGSTRSPGTRWTSTTS